MLRYYPAVIEKEAESDYGVSFPDFPGCVSAGATATKAMDGGAEALALHIRGMIEDKAPLPEPTAPDPEVIGIVEPAPKPGHYKVLTLVPVQVHGRSKRINVTLDEALLAEIDSQTHNRSAFLDEAARALLASRK